MGAEQPRDLSERVVGAAERVLEVKGYVSPIELLMQMRLLQPAAVRRWENGECDCLEPFIQGSSKKLSMVWDIFAVWARSKQMSPVRAALRSSGREQSHDLRISADGATQIEEFFRTCYAAPDLTPSKLEALTSKLNKPPDLVVFKTVSDSATCGECGAEIESGGFLFREKTVSLCLTCADLDRLEFLPSGDAALSRRARKHSALAAVVVEFNRRAKRYERRGVLVSPEAITLAEAECRSDAERRAARSERAVGQRAEADVAFMREMAGMIVGLYPGCPPAEAADIAAHAGLRGSGRVGRSLAGRHLQEEAIRLAVVAHVRHVHTRYDELLMEGMARQDARAAIADRIVAVLSQWRRGSERP